MKRTSAEMDPVRILSETEIQDRLYGAYRPGGSKRQTTATSSDSLWTGSQILEGEVQRLRSELISLREEKNRLESQIQKIGPPAARVSEPVSGGGGWLGRLLGMMMLAGLAGYLLSVEMLQASPSPAGMEATPYTVQVAVYDGPVLAHRAEAFLKELGYDAFLVENPRRTGGTRYRIYVGSFVTQEEARLENNRLAADRRFQVFKDAFVRVR